MKNFPGGKELNKNYPHSTVEGYLGLYGHRTLVKSA